MVTGPAGSTPALLHREDHSGLTAGLVVAAVVVTATAALSIRLGGVGAGIGGGLLFVALVAWIFLYEAWLLGLRIDEREVRIGATGRAERRARRGRPPARRASPAFNFLYEYGCPVEAIRRAWVVRGVAASWNPRSATGVEPVVGAPGDVRSRLGWMRVPLVRSALMLEVDMTCAAWPRFGDSTWRAFAPVPVESVSVRSDVWYTPVRHPKPAWSALTEALGRAGRSIDAEGRIGASGSAAE
jgi:hypothetical protein